MLPGLRFIAKIRLADEYYAAQDRAEVASNGGARNFNVGPSKVESVVVHNVYGLPGFIFYSR